MNISAEMAFIRRINTDSLLLAGYVGMFFFLPVATSPTAICGAFVLAVWIVSRRFPGDIRKWFGSDLALPVALLIILPWFGLLYTPLPDHGLRIAMKTHYWLYAIALAPVLTLKGKSDLTIKMFLAGLSINSAISILQFGGIVPLKKGVSTGLLGGSSSWISYSLLLALGILIASSYFSKAGSKKERSLYAALILQYVITTGFIGGRSGYVALIILSPFVVYNITGQRHVVKILIGSIIAVSLLFAFPIVRDRFLKAKEDIVLYRQGNVSTSLGLRFHMWEIAAKEIVRKPLWGTGTGSFRQAWEMKKKDRSLPFFDHPHNSYLFMTVSYGLPGLIAFCWVLYVMLKRGWRGRHTPLGFSVFAFTAVFAIGSLTDTQVLVFATATAFPLFAGISEATIA